MVNHIKRERVKAKWGLKWYTSLLDCKGVIICLDKSLKASKRGCKRPIKETLLGPTRIWKRPITLRSKRVKKATDKNTKRQWTNQDRTILIIKEYFLKYL